MIKYNNTNNASTTLTAGISPSSTTLIVENGDILPTAPFLLTLEHFDNEKVTVREIVKCIAKVGTILTIQRGAGTCVQDDSATPKAQNNTPHSFSVGDCASIYWTSEQVQDIQNEIEKKLNIDDFQAGTYVYGATSTGTDAYSITIPGTVTSYQLGQVFRFMADVQNTGSATLNVNGIGAIEILKNHDQHLQSGDIEAGQIVEVAFDGTNFQMNSQVATVVDISNIGETKYLNMVACEYIDEGVACCINEASDYTDLIEVGKNVSFSNMNVIGTGVSSNFIKLWIAREGGEAGEPLVCELLDGETILKTATITRSSLTCETQEKTIVFDSAIETIKGKIYTLRLRTNNNGISDAYYTINARKPLNILNHGSTKQVEGNSLNDFDLYFVSNGDFSISVGNSTTFTKSGTSLTNSFSDTATISTQTQFRVKKNINEISFFYKLTTDVTWSVLGTHYIDPTTSLNYSCSVTSGINNISEMFLNGYKTGTTNYVYEMRDVSPDAVKDATINGIKGAGQSTYTIQGGALGFNIYNNTSSNSNNALTITDGTNTINITTYNYAIRESINGGEVTKIGDRDTCYVMFDFDNGIYISGGVKKSINWGNEITITANTTKNLQLHNIYENVYNTTNNVNFDGIFETRRIKRKTADDKVYGPLINSYPVSQGSIAQLEIGGYSKVVNANGTVYIQNDGSLDNVKTYYVLGEKDYTGRFEYKFKDHTPITFSYSVSSMGPKNKTYTVQKRGLFSYKLSFGATSSGSLYVKLNGNTIETASVSSSTSHTTERAKEIQVEKGDFLELDVQAFNNDSSKIEYSFISI